MGDKEDILNDFEWHDLNPGAQWYDSLEKRIFINVTKEALKVGFGHNARRMEIIAIGPGIAKDPALEALEGEVVEG